MNTKAVFQTLGGGLLAAGLAVSAAAQSFTATYEVTFKDERVATQTVTIAKSGDLTTVATSFAADLPVFVALHHYAEDLSASFRPDGTVERLAASRHDGPIHISVSGSRLANGLLRLVRTDMDGTTTSLVARADYDFNSLAMYSTAPAGFLPTNNPARVLSVADGRIEPVAIQTISESDTFERQHLVSTHLVWTAGIHVSHSWHPERFSNLPRRYIRQTENGEFTFTLIR